MPAGRSPTKLAATLATALAAAVAVAAALTLTSGVSSARTVTVLGDVAAKPSCPARCLVEARVTGFQATIGRRGKPYRAPVDGRITAWSVRLGKPRGPDIRLFNGRFKRSKAKISVLRSFRVKRGRDRGKIKYKLKRQSPVQRLRPYFGTTTTFFLERPLVVRRGEVVALTIPTWAPAFSVKQGRRTKWKASRKPTRKRGGCTVEGGFANVKAGKPHGKLKSARRYACAYKGARLLYQVTIVSP